MSRIMLVLLISLLLFGCTANSSEPATPQAVAIIWPGANESVDAQPVLQWDAFANAAQYRIIITATGANEPVFTETTTEMVMPVSPALPAAASYTWTVQALDEAGNVIGEFSSTFRVKDSITAVWPNNGESVDNKPILQWKAYPDAAEYHLIVVDDDAFPPVVAFDQTTAETMMEIAPELEPGSFSWTVQAVDNEGTVVAELNSQFLVKALMEVVEPANLASTSATPALVWKPFTNAVNYQVILLDDDAFPPVVVIDEETAQTSLAVTDPLEPGSYSWTVWAKDANGITVAEANNQFVVKP